MEVREILVANTKTQTRSTIMTDATTLGELKKAFDDNGIDYEGMTITVGRPKTTLIDDDAQLPTNIEFKGQTTNNLVILLTNTKDKISSGIVEDRKTAYEVIKNNGLQESVKKEFGDNYTHVATEDLWDFIHDNLDDEEYGDDNSEETSSPSHPSYAGASIAESMYNSIKALVKTGEMSAEAVDSMIDCLQELSYITKETANSAFKVGNVEITDSDIDAMIAGLN
jgi:hypothetical protein